MITVVLVEPRYQGNVGSVARVAKNFGVRDVALVDPPVLGGEARQFSAGAADVLAEARVLTDLSILDDQDLVVGTSGIRAEGDKNHNRVPLHTPAELAEKLDGTAGDVALLFGREDTGLRNEELDRCDLFVSIPTSEEYPVMNLSHAVAVVMYELRGLEPGSVERAPREVLDRVYSEAEDLVRSSPHPEHKKQRSSDMLKGILGRADLTAREAHTLAGLLKDLGR